MYSLELEKRLGLQYGYSGFSSCNFIDEMLKQNSLTYFYFGVLKTSLHFLDFSQVFKSYSIVGLVKKKNYLLIS